MSWDGDENRSGWTEYEGLSLPGSDSADEADGSEAASDEGDWGPPPTMRDPLLRDRLRDRLGVTPRQWYVIEALLIALPYPFFVALYLFYPVDEALFLVVTLAYSLVATYVGFIS